MYKIAVIGGLGRVGLPFSLCNIKAGNQVSIVDRNQSTIDFITHNRRSPFIESGADEIIQDKSLSNNWKIHTSLKTVNVEQLDCIVVMIGTPVDGEGNPRLDDIAEFFSNEIPYDRLPDDIMFILRSTVAPGTTQIIDKIIKMNTDKKYILAFCPERVLQGKGIEETNTLPVLIGTKLYCEFVSVSNYFKSFNEAEHKHLSWEEAEFGKLITNMYRYINIAFANELYLLGRKRGIDVHKTIKAVNSGYKRVNIPTPGPNAAGPCLYKDGKFLLQDVPFADLIQVSFMINEGMPGQIVSIIKEKHPEAKNVLILGMTFKANNDDTRNSLSFKLKKILGQSGYGIFTYDPYVNRGVPNTEDVDCIVIMTPHDEFKSLVDFIPKNKKCLIVDIWKHSYAGENYTKDGVYFT